MVKDHSDSERGNPLPPHGLLFPISSKVSFICIIPPRQDNTYHGLCYTSRGALAGTRNSSMGAEIIKRTKTGEQNNETMLKGRMVSFIHWTEFL